MAAQAPSFGELRSLLAQPPGKINWVRLCLLLDEAYRACPEEVAKLWVPYAERALASWPAPLRVSPMQWFVPLELGHTVPMLTLVRVLDWSDAALSYNTLSTLTQCPELAHLESLDLSFNPIEDDSLAMILGDACWHRSLRQLNVASCGITDAALTLALTRFRCVALRELDLSDNELITDALGLLLACESLARLDSLILKHFSGHGGDWLRMKATQDPRLSCD